MATGLQQLTTDYEQLVEALELYPNITIVQSEGHPPDKYEIEYTLRGYIREAGSTITVGHKHRVRLSLPFGYPHFAPVAKPLTPIFHPDFDPAAIRLADWWQQHPSLPDLVLHIGELICGTIFNLEDPFNQEAADWYARHRDELPLDALSIATIEPTDMALDSLFEDTFASLGLGGNDFFEPEKPSNSREIVRELMEQRKIFTAKKLLADIPETVDFPNREEIQQTIARVLRKTDQLYKLAEQLEEVAKYQEALEVVDNLLGVAADTPGVETLRTRLQQSFQLTRAAQLTVSKEATDERSDVAVDPPTTPPLPPPSSPSRQQEPARSIRLSLVPILAGLAILVITSAAIFLYIQDAAIVNQAQSSLQQAKSQIEKNQFQEALSTLEAGKTSLSQLTLLRFRKSDQEQQLNSLINSAELQEGLKGRIFYQGEYIPLEAISAHEILGPLTEQAQALADQNKLAESLSLYRQAHSYAAKHKLTKQQALINEIIVSLELRHSLAIAERAEQTGNWTEATAAYRQALTLSGNLKSQGTASDIAHRLTAAAFRHELDQSKRAFTHSQWKETVKYLEQAQQTLALNPSVVTEKERQDLQHLLINARLYLALSNAREAFQEKNWELSIEQYEHALKLLSGEPGGPELPRESITKIKKTLLLVKIAQIQEMVLVAESRPDPTAVLNHSNEILRLIKASDFQSDTAVKEVVQKINLKMERQQDMIVQQEKLIWLENHFEEIFRNNYPTHKGSKLMQPKTVFLKKSGSRMIYMLTCMEHSQGRSAKIELQYQFDIASGKWSVYDN